MLRIVDRYLLREILWSFFASTFMLLLVTVGGVLADLLAKVARGRIPTDLLLTLIGLRMVDALTLLLPLAVFLGVLLAYGRLYRDSEMAVFAASGLTITGLLRPLLFFAVPMVITLSVLSFWLAPTAVRASQTLLQEASRSLVVAGLEPGRFVELPGRDGIIYVGGMNGDGTSFQHMFVQSEHADKDGKQRLDIITAERGELFLDANGIERYLRFENGFRVEGVLGQNDFRLMRYAGNDVKLPESDNGETPASVKRSAPTTALINSDDPVQRSELAWRLASPISTLVLMLLALPLSRSTPREPRYSKLLIGMLCYLIYSNVLALGRNWISLNKISTDITLWWVHLPVLVIALWLLWRSQRLPRSRFSGRRKSI